MNQLQDLGSLLFGTVIIFMFFFTVGFTDDFKNLPESHLFLTWIIIPTFFFGLTCFAIGSFESLRNRGVAK